MVKREKIAKKARVALEKAEILLDNGREKRAADSFRKAGEYYGELNEWKVAEQCFYYASKTYMKIGDELNLHRASYMQRAGANACVFLDQFTKAHDYFNVAGKSILKTGAKEADDFATQNFCFAFMCLFVQGQLEDAINYVKRFKSLIPITQYQNHQLMHLVRKITNSYLKQKEAYIDEIIDDFNRLKYDPGEMNLIKETLIVALAALMIDYKIELSDSDYERDQIIPVPTILEYDRLKEFKNYTILPRVFNKIAVINTTIHVQENISTKERPTFPIDFDLKNFAPLNLPFSFRANFPGKSAIGPIDLTIEIDEKYQFKVRTQQIPIEIFSPQAILGVNLNPLKTPIINQTFPLEVVVSNQSDGNAMEIEVEFEFPEDLKLMRGTNKKKIYALSPNEDITWDIRVKAFDVGKIPIKTIVRFKDGDGIEKGPFTAELPLEINL